MKLIKLNDNEIKRMSSIKKRAAQKYGREKKKNKKRKER